MKQTYLVLLIVSISLIVFAFGCTKNELNTKSNVVSNTPDANTNIVQCSNECTSDECDGFVYKSCEKQSNGCYAFVNKGIIIGKCGVECLTNTDCANGEECVNYTCVTVTKTGNTRNNPLSLGTEGEITMENWDGQLALVKISVVGIKRGQQAWEMIREANMFNDEPSEGKEYLLAKIRLTVEKTSNNKSYEIDQFYFEAVSENGVVYETPFVVDPEPEFYGELYPGGTIEGWMTFEVDKSDAHPLLRVTGAENSELWIKLY